MKKYSSRNHGKQNSRGGIRSDEKKKASGAARRGSEKKRTVNAGRKNSRSGNYGTEQSTHAEALRAGFLPEAHAGSEKRSRPVLSDGQPLPELLAPCGSEEAIYAAISGGADAVYCGGRMLNARMNAKNFDDDALRRAVYACHDSGVKLYVAFNTLVYDRELRDAAEYAEMLYRIGVDGVIVADPGLASLLHEYLPDLPLHASTQLSAHDLESAQRLAELGFTRMVPARELSLADIGYLCKNSPIETEVFVHGALCVSRSGQCLMSSVVGGRSGNRGECAQPCRLPYNGAYPLSLRDLCLAGHITELIGCGVSSLKIEGRMKSPAYIEGVTRIYRRLLDEGRNASQQETEALKNIFSRGGFTDGYFTDRIGKSMLGVRSERDKTASRISASAGGRAKQTACPDLTQRIAGEEKRLPALPLEQTGAMKALSKTPAESGKSGETTTSKKTRSARFLHADAIPTEAKDCFDMIALPLGEFVKSGGGNANAVILPCAVHDSERAKVEELLLCARELGAEHCYVGNIGQLGLASRYGFRLHGDFRLNITNSAAADQYMRLCEFEDMILSPELILPRVRDIRTCRKSLIVYGRLPLMILERCTGERSLRDRRGVVFPVYPEADMPGVRPRETVYNSCPVWMADRRRELLSAGISDMHFIFTGETARECLSVISAYENKLPPPEGLTVKRIK